MPDDVTISADSLIRLEAKIDQLNQRVEDVQRVYTSMGELYRDMAPIGASMMEVASDHIAALEEQGLFTLLSELNEVATSRNGTQKAPPSMFALVRAAAKDEDVRRGLVVAIDLLRTLGENKHRAVPSDPRKAKAQALAAMLAPKTRLNDTSSTWIPPQLTPSGSEPSCPAPAHSVSSGENAPAPTEQPSRPPGWTLDTDDDGFLRDPQAWHLAFAEDMAQQANIALTERHWAVINFMREEFGSTGRSPNIRRITTGSGVETRELFDLFPKAPAKTAARIAGVPKPVGCV